ncbi:MAG: polysaccharide deacetylase family protein [Clostridia bacterium]|nr:polysaccharide deacetylase family protein [Clostridia bacterium]
MKYNFLRYPKGKTKAVTLSYDDGSKSDARFAETINQYGLKCTFNLVGSLVDQEIGLTKEFIRTEILAKGHEIATHGYNHRALDRVRPIEGIRDTLDCRLTLEREFDIIIRGMAFPDRSVNRFKFPDAYSTVRSYLEELGIAYVRTIGGDNDSFELPDDWFNWMPSAHHENPQLTQYMEDFLALDVNQQYCSRRAPRLFYLWGHAFEFDRAGNWDRLEMICETLAGKEDIWYATNMEIYEYVQAYRSLIYSADGMTVYNPTLMEIWFDIDGKLYSIKSGETLRL